MASFPAFLAASQLHGAEKKTQHSLWIGSCGHNAKSGIYHAWFDAGTGKLQEPVLAAATPVPSWFTMMRDTTGRQILYTANESMRSNGGISSFIVGADNASLTPLNHVAFPDGPCYVSASIAKRTLYTANYTGGTVTVVSVLPDGSLGSIVQHLDFKDTARFGKSGPHPRQGAPHPHSTTLSPDGKFVITDDFGNDSIDIFTIAPDGQLTGPVLVKTPPENGPRHIAFHPNDRWVYGINELGNTLRQYQWQEHNGTAELRYLDHSISTMAPDAPPISTPITASEVAITPDGKFLYACTRGDDTLTVFDIAPKDGTLHFKQSIPSGGKEPRHFTLDPTGGWIICSNDESAAVTIFYRDQITGRLTGPVQTIAIDVPQFALFS